MNQDFSFKRVWMLIQKQGTENAKLYGVGALALFGLLAFAIAIFWIADPDTEPPVSTYDEEKLFTIFSFGLWLAGSVFASMSFSMLGSKEKGVHWLMFPATHFEKLICAIFYTTVVFGLAYFLFILILDPLAVAYVSGKPGYRLKRIDWNNPDGIGRVWPFLVLTFLGIQALYVLGSVYFKQFSFIKTTVVAAIIISIFIWYVFGLRDAFFDNERFNYLTLEKRDYSSHTIKIYELSSFGDKLMKFLLWGMWCPVFWTITWFRLKEKEI